MTPLDRMVSALVLSAALRRPPCLAMSWPAPPRQPHTAQEAHLKVLDRYVRK